ncbi:MAG: hypothetical protein RR662_03945 [Clostridia bacterium]
MTQILISALTNISLLTVILLVIALLTVIVGFIILAVKEIDSY